MRTTLVPFFAITGSAANGPVASTHRLLSPIGERAPYPFERTEFEIAEPDSRRDDLEHPNSPDDIVKLVVFKVIVLAQAITIKEQGADDALG